MGLVYTSCRDSFALGELSSITGGRAGPYRSFFVAWGVVPNSQKLANTDVKVDDSTGPVVLAENARQAGHACGPVSSATEAPVENASPCVQISPSAPLLIPLVYRPKENHENL